MAESSGAAKPGKVVAKDGHVYHKSTTANSTIAPTNAATLANATKQGSLTADQLDFVTIVHYEFGLLGELPSVDYLKQNYGYKAEEVADNYKNELIKAALVERGLNVSDNKLGPVGITSAKKPKPTPKLSPLQLIVANTLLDLTNTKSERKKLQDLGVTTMTYQSWLRDPDFSGYLRDRTEAMIGDVQHEAMLALMDRVRAGDMKAIAYYHELTGRFTPQSASGAPNVDLQTILIRLIEIITEEVHDPLVASRIAERIKGLVAGGQIAGALTGGIPFGQPEVRQPEIAKPREQTQHVKELMAKGVGVNS